MTKLHSLNSITNFKFSGKVEISHRTDKQEFYQLLEYTGVCVGLNKKIKVSENFYNFNRPHNLNGGLTPYEISRAKMKINILS